MGERRKEGLMIIVIAVQFVLVLTLVLRLDTLEKRFDKLLSIVQDFDDDQHKLNLGVAKAIKEIRKRL